MKSASKVNATAKSTIALSASVKTLINEAVGAAETADLAATNRDQKLTKLAEALTATKGEREAIRETVQPLWLEAFTKANAKRPERKRLTAEGVEKYAGEQLSRLFSLVKTLRGDSEKKGAKETAERAIKEGESFNKVLAAARGSMKYDKKGALIIAKGDNRGGKNRVKPIDAYKKAIETAVTAGATAKLDLLPMGNAFIDALKACELIDEDEAEKLSEAFEEIG